MVRRLALHTGGFTLVEGLSTSLSAGQQDTFTLRLDTGVGGTFSGEISFANSDDDDWAFEYHEADVELKAAQAKHNRLKALGIERVGSADGLDSRKFKATYKPNKNGKRTFRMTWRGKAAVPTMEGMDDDG